jgi:hypothetical protein
LFFILRFPTKTLFAFQFIRCHKKQQVTQCSKIKKDGMSHQKNRNNDYSETLIT